MGVAFGSHNTKPNSVTQMLLGLGPEYLVHILAKGEFEFSFGGPEGLWLLRSPQPSPKAELHEGDLVPTAADEAVRETETAVTYAGNKAITSPIMPLHLCLTSHLSVLPQVPEQS